MLDLILADAFDDFDDQGVEPTEAMISLASKVGVERMEKFPLSGDCDYGLDPS